MREVLVPFSGKVNAVMMLEAAFRFAQEHDAHLTCLHLLKDPDALVTSFDEMSLYAPGGARDEVARSAQKNLQQAKRSFSAVAEYMGVETGSGKKAEFIHETAGFEQAIARHGRLSDIIFMRQTGEDKTPEQDIAMHAALFDTGRPVMVVPERKITSFTNHVAIAWSDSRESALALRHAMPLLKKAKRVTVIIGNKNTKAANELSQPVLRYLSQHGIKAKHEAIVTGADIEASLLRRCHEIGADLLVMGAFSHHRIRQFVLGGMTRYMLEHADIPLFMAH